MRLGGNRISTVFMTDKILMENSFCPSHELILRLHLSLAAVLSYFHGIWTSPMVMLMDWLLLYLMADFSLIIIARRLKEIR